MNDLTNYTDPEAHQIIFAQSDLSARFNLLDRAEAEYNDGNSRGAACLFHAEMYLSDRLWYEMNPPPTKTAIPDPRTSWGRPKQHGKQPEGKKE